MTASLRLLVVDDNHDVLRAMRRMLRDYEVAVVDDARSALAIIRAGARFDAILSDLHMPHMDGRTLHARLSDEACGQAERMIFVAGSVDEPDEAAFLASTGALFLRKPAIPMEVRLAVAAVSGARRDGG